MTDIMVAIGLRQLDRYPGMLARRKEIVARYDEMCDELGVKHLIHSGENFNSSHHLYLTRIPGIPVVAVPSEVSCTVRSQRQSRSS